MYFPVNEDLLNCFKIINLKLSVTVEPGWWKKPKRVIKLSIFRNSGADIFRYQ